MKRLLLIVPGAVAALLAGQAAGWSQEYAVPAPAAPAPHREVVPAPAKDPHKHGSTVHAINEKLVRDLTAILKKTKSTDTFLVTVKALADMGPRAKPAVPAIILNAERLGLLKDIMQQVDDDSDDDCPGDFIVEAIAQIVASKEARRAQGAGVPTTFPEMLPAPRMVRPLTYPAVAPPAAVTVNPPALLPH
jgi:hypothetical protein